MSKGTVLAINEDHDGRLLVWPNRHGEQPPLTVIIEPEEHLSREIIGKYLLGFDIIRVECKCPVKLDVRETVKKTVDRLIGLEIVEEDHSSIVLQCLLDPSGFPPEKILRRGYAIVAGMHRDAINALVSGDSELARGVIPRDDESDRLYFLLVRILRTIVQNPDLNEKLGVKPIECLDYRLVASLVEAIGDECARIAQRITEMKNMEIGGNLRELFADLHLACFGAHEKALKAFLAGDMEKAEEVRTMREKIGKTAGQIEKTARAQRLDLVSQVLAIASLLEQIYEHSVDVADLVVPRKA